MNRLPEVMEGELAVLAEKEAIVFFDIPAATAEDWCDAQRGKFYRRIKQQLTLRIDADILDWLKSDGNGYQRRLNHHCALQSSAMAQVIISNGALFT